MNSAVRLCLLVVAFGLLSACAIQRLGPPPGDQDLTNDGTPAAQQQLFEEYRLSYVGGVFTRPQAAPKKEGGRDVIYRADAESDEAAAYIATSPAATQRYSGLLLGAHRAVTSTFAYFVIDTVFMGLGLCGGAGLAAAAVAASGNAATIVNSALVGALAGLCVGSFCSGLTDSGVYYIGRPMLIVAAQGEYANLTEDYNRDLRARIQRLAKASP